MPASESESAQEEEIIPLRQAAFCAAAAAVRASKGRQGAPVPGGFSAD